MRGSPARPGQLALEGKAKEEFLNSARMGHEDDGGEGPFGRELSCPRGKVSQSVKEKGTPLRGGRFYHLPLWTRLSLSLANFRRKGELNLFVL